MKASSRLAVLVLVVVTGCARMMQPSATTATAELQNTQGQPVGTATFSEVTGGVRIVLEVRGLPPGEKGVHIHEVGKCEPPAFTSAGGHFNPGRKQHGLQNPQGPHAGDLPNITVGTDGSGRMETTTNRITLGGGETGILDDDGSALVIHAAADDFKTDPTGNSGARMACGVITKSRGTSGQTRPERRAGY